MSLIRPNLKSLYTRMLCTKFESLFEIGLVILEKKKIMWKTTMIDDDIAQIAIRKAYLGLRLRWAKKCEYYIKSVQVKKIWSVNGAIIHFSIYFELFWLNKISNRLSMRCKFKYPKSWNLVEKHINLRRIVILFFASIVSRIIFLPCNWTSLEWNWHTWFIKVAFIFS